METAVRVAQALGLCVALGAGLWLAALAVGLGRCHTCRKLIPPMEAYCAEHYGSSPTEGEPPGT